MMDGGAGFTTLPDHQELPCNIEIEQALLGAILMNNECLSKVQDFLKPEMFFEPVHERIYDTCSKLIAKGQIANPPKLKVYFERDEALADIGGAQYLVRLAASAATIINAEDYGRTLFDLSIRRNLIEIAEQAKYMAFNAPVDESSSEQIEEIEGKLHELKGYEPKRGRLVRSSAQVVESALQRIEDAERSGGVTGLTTGLSTLDRMITLNPAEVTVIAGRPSMGKSALANHIAFASSHGCGITAPTGCIFFSKEMDGEDNVYRAISAQISRTHGRTLPYFVIKKGNLSDADKTLVREAAEIVSKANIKWVDESRLTPSRILSIVKREQRNFERSGIPLGAVLVDYLQQVKPDGRPMSAYDETRIASSFMLELAKEFHIPVLPVSQLNRSVEQRDDKRPMLSDFRDSGTIEQDAANVIFPFREEYYLKKEAEACPSQDMQMKLDKVSGKTELIIAKNRNGPTGTVTIHSNMAANHFKDLS